MSSAVIEVATTDEDSIRVRLVHASVNAVSDGILSLTNARPSPRMASRDIVLPETFNLVKGNEVHVCSTLKNANIPEILKLEPAAFVRPYNPGQGCTATVKRVQR